MVSNQILILACIERNFNYNKKFHDFVQNSPALPYVFFSVGRVTLGRRVSVLEQDQLERCRTGSKFSPFKEASGKKRG